LEWGARLWRGEGGENVLSVLMSWLIRGLMAIGGIVLVYEGLPVASAAFQAQKSDAVVMKLRRVEKMTVPDVSAGIEALNRAIVLNPVAGRYLLRSELEGGAALTQTLNVSLNYRTLWLRRAKADLELGLTHAPARSIDWLRLAVTQQGLDGPSREVVGSLFMSIRTGPWLEPAFSVRLRLILDNWAYFSDEQKEELRKYVVEVWRHSHDHIFFGSNVLNPVDEVIIRNLLKDEPGAQEILTKWILAK
jgi:hypothetical protein